MRLNKKATIKFKQLSFIGGLFFVIILVFLVNIKLTESALLNGYSKNDGDTLEAYEWNQLLADFVKKNDDGDVMYGNYGLNMTASSSYALSITGGLWADVVFSDTSFIGFLEADNVSDGLFGGNTGLGNYYFPNNLSIGIGTTTNSLLTIANDEWVSAMNNAGTGFVNILKVNASDEIELGSSLNIGNFQFAPDSGFNTFVDMSVTSASPNDSVQGYVMKVDGDNILTVFSQSDGLGGIKNKRIGINTSSPQFDLDVSGIVNASNFYVNGSPYIGSQWLNNGNDIYYNLGNVGIGTDSPSGKLDIRDNLALGASSPLFSVHNNSIIRTQINTKGHQSWHLNNDIDEVGEVAITTPGGYPGIVVHTGTTSPQDQFEMINVGEYFKFGHKEDEALDGGIYVEKGGDIGIGVDTPATRLHISNVGEGVSGVALTVGINDSSSDSAIIDLSRGSINRVSGIDYKTGSTTNWFTGMYYNTGMGQTYFGIGTSQNKANQKMIINTSGHVGIGTTTPTSKLHIGDNVTSLLDPVFQIYNNNILRTRIEGKGSTRIYLSDATGIERGAVQISTYLNNPAIAMTTGPNYNQNEFILANFGSYYSLSYSPFYNGGLIISSNNNIGAGTSTPTGSKLVFEAGTGSKIDITGGYIKGLDLTPIDDDHAVPKYYVDNNFISSSTIPTIENIWSLIGNATGSDNAFLGSTDNQDISFRTNNIERMRIVKGGNVGIGTSNPETYKLKVDGNVAITGTLQTQTGSDFAEEFSVRANIEPATVVVMSSDGHKSVRISENSYDHTVVGIVSDNPSIIAGRVDSKYKVVVAMMGVVSVKVSNINGQIKAGDLLTTSSISGRAMRATEFKPGTIIGKALEDLQGSQGKIKVLVNLQ